VALTRNLIRAADLLRNALVHHIILAENQFYSLWAEGDLRS
jgi:DNA repair protein RadC